MRQSTLVTILLILLMIGGWSSALLENDTEDKEVYNEHLYMAEEYNARGLYQKAIEEYNAALFIENTEDIYANLLGVHEKYYAENTEAYGGYVQALLTAVSNYSQNTEYLLDLSELYLVRDDYASAYKVLKNAVESGIEDAKIMKLFSQVKYAYELQWKTYEDYRTFLNGSYAVNATGVWNYILEDGTETKFSQLRMAGSVGESGIRVIQNEKRTELVDGNGVIWGIIDFEPKDAGVYAEGLIAVSNDDSYGYYNSLGDKMFGDYAMAGTFTNGQAAVLQGEKWFLIDKTGEKISDKVYEDIVLHANKSHLSHGVMLAKENGIYKFYTEQGEYGNYVDVDIITADAMVAVCNNGKWGYADLTGNEIIAPKYAEAKSFSNGLAAVSDGKKWGFINTAGELVIDYTFLDADYFNASNKCMVKTGKDNWQLLSLYIEE